MPRPGGSWFGPPSLSVQALGLNPGPPCPPPGPPGARQPLPAPTGSSLAPESLSLQPDCGGRPPCGPQLTPAPGGSCRAPESLSVQPDCDGRPPYGPQRTPAPGASCRAPKSLSVQPCWAAPEPAPTTVAAAAPRPTPNAPSNDRRDMERCEEMSLSVRVRGLSGNFLSIWKSPKGAALINAYRSDQATSRSLTPSGLARIRHCSGGYAKFPLPVCPAAASARRRPGAHAGRLKKGPQQAGSWGAESSAPVRGRQFANRMENRSALSCCCLRFALLASFLL
jgi:hypothetical protein